MKIRWYYIAIIFLLALLVWLVLGFRGCDIRADQTTDKLKQEVKLAKEKKDSVHVVVEYRDRIREKEVVKWITIRHDSLVPCEEKLICCDTVIYVDSTLISELKQEIKTDNEIILGQDKTIVDLTKSVKRQKRRTRIVAALALLIGGIALSK